jgi:hypothetical protein
MEHMLFDKASCGVRLQVRSAVSPSIVSGLVVAAVMPFLFSHRIFYMRQFAFSPHALSISDKQYDIWGMINSLLL